MQAKIKMEGLSFYAYHGYYEHEQLKGNNFVVDVEIELEIEDKALKEDDINGTLNYEQLHFLIKKEMEIKSKLLENVAFRIKTAIEKTFPEIKHTSISVAKLQPPINGAIKLVKIVL